MSKRDSQFVALRQRQEKKRSAEDVEYLKRLGIKSRQELAPDLSMRGVHEPMNVFELAATGNWPTLSKIGANIAEDVVRMPQQMFGPSGPEAERLHQLYGTQPERYTPELDPIEESQADLAQLLLAAIEPGPGGTSGAATLFGRGITRAKEAAVLNVLRRRIKGPARKALLERRTKGMVLQDIPEGLVEGQALADVDFDVIRADLGDLTAETPEALTRFEKRLSTVQRRTREAEYKRGKALHKRMSKRYGEDLPPLDPIELYPEQPISRTRIAESGPHPLSSRGHEKLHEMEFGAPTLTREELQRTAVGANPVRPDLPEFEQPVYALQEQMAGERPTMRFDLETLEAAKTRGHDIPDELFEQARLREAWERYGVDVKGLEGAIPRMRPDSPEEAAWLEEVLAPLARWKRRSRQPGYEAPWVGDPDMQSLPYISEGLAQRMTRRR